MIPWDHLAAIVRLLGLLLGYGAAVAAGEKDLVTMLEGIKTKPSDIVFTGSGGIAESATQTGAPDGETEVRFYVGTLGQTYPVDVSVNESERPCVLTGCLVPNGVNCLTEMKLRFLPIITHMEANAVANAVPTEISDHVNSELDCINAIVTEFEDSCVAEFMKHARVADACAATMGPKRNVSDPGEYEHAAPCTGRGCSGSNIHRVRKPKAPALP